MKIVILDTEYTSWEGSLQRNWSNENEHKEIVQIAAILVDVNILKELEFCSILIKPSINHVLSDYFIKLTGINNEMITQAKTFNEGIKEFKSFVDNKKVYACGEEGKIILENLRLNCNNDFLESTIVYDLRPWFSKNGVNAEKINSGELHKYLGISLNGSAHNALHDVRSILVSIDYLVKEGASNPFMK